MGIGFGYGSSMGMGGSMGMGFGMGGDMGLGSSMGAMMGVDYDEQRRRDEKMARMVVMMQLPRSGSRQHAAVGLAAGSKRQAGRI
jgi:hypothetical protein